MNINYKYNIIKIRPFVYEPSEDSFLLAEAALSAIKDSDRILEVGCGSGIVSAVLKAKTKAKIVGIDINPHAVQCAKENGVEVVRGDLLSCFSGKFDVILFNPPYLPTRNVERTKDWLNVALDGGYDGRRTIYRFLKEAGAHLFEKGRILMLLSSLTGIREVKSKMESLGYAVEDKLRERFMFEQLIVLVGTKK